jgi:hypothetical protein
MQVPDHHVHPTAFTKVLSSRLFSCHKADNIVVIPQKLVCLFQCGGAGERLHHRVGCGGMRLLWPAACKPFRDPTPKKGKPSPAAGGGSSEGIIAGGAGGHLVFAYVVGERTVAKGGDGGHHAFIV